VLGQFVADLVGQGAMAGDVKLALDEVRQALVPREIDTTGRPSYGNENAPVTMVVFADFECPHCRQEAPVVRKLVQDRRGQVRLVYRHYPLNMHPRAHVAAIATEAAHAQGKFWEMHDAVFDHQTQLEDEDLERYAREIEGLDFTAWKAHFEARKGEKQVEADRAAGDQLGITGTPAVFINGRYFHPGLFGGTLDGWVDDALRR
jgi:protein-disulfide isomerase